MIARIPEICLHSLYRDVILEHNRTPRNIQELSKPDAIAEGFNPMCGDKLKLQIEVDALGKISNICAQCQGCSISVSSGSIMTEEIVGKSVDEARAMVDQFREMMRGEAKMESVTGDLDALEGVKNFPVRIKCALLPWATLAQAIDRLKVQPANEASPVSTDHEGAP